MLFRAHSSLNNLASNSTLQKTSFELGHVNREFSNRSYDYRETLLKLDYPNNGFNNTSYDYGEILLELDYPNYRFNNKSYNYCIK